jgi:hydroxyethylthiazole kinase-like uncharacterized protein yjeF
MSLSETASFQMTDAHWAALSKCGDGHKYAYGHAAILSGPAGQGGAARLAARGALRIGSGLVSVLCQCSALAEHAAQLNAIMVKPYADVDEVPERLMSLKVSAVCIGPNLGLDDHARDVLCHCIRAGRPMCLDADAITLMSADSLPQITNGQTVLTPHEGELKRYIPDQFDKTTDRRSLARYAAEKAGCVVLFKGPETIIAAPDGQTTVVSSKSRPHAAWLATAGSGDVLSGFVTGLLARGFTAFDAAAVATDLHFRCAGQFGPGLIAEDIPEMLPSVLQSAL